MIPGIVAGLPVTVSPPGGGYFAEVMADNPVGYWRLDETSGTTVIDVGSLGIDGTSANATLAQTSLCGDGGDFSYGFNGSTSKVSILDTTSYPDVSPGFTMECLINTTDATGLQGILSTGSNRPYIRLSGGSIQFLASQVAFLGTFSSGVVDNTTYHIAVVVEADGSANYYLNGVDVGGNGSNAFALTSLDAGMFIGCENSSTDFFDGRIDEAAIYYTALSAARIAAHAAAAGL